MKRLGFLTGAVLAAVGVFVFHTLRAVDDDDRLMAALAEECLPYVFGGQDVPFENLGRSPGVYDVVDVDDRVTGGGLRLIHDLRFLAQWGVVETAVGAVRICEVNPTFGENTIAAFEVDPDGFVGRYTDVIGRLCSAHSGARGGHLWTGRFGVVRGGAPARQRRARGHGGKPRSCVQRVDRP